jgi:uncharacterized protein (TIGR02588 family)
MTKSAAKTHRETSKAHWIEWVTGLASSVIVAAMIGWIGTDALRPYDQVPSLNVKLLSTDTRGQTHIARFEIANAADATASAVEIRGELKDGTYPVETVTVTLDYVPGNSKASGGLIFRSDPRGKNIDIAVIGYADP